MMFVVMHVLVAVSHIFVSMLMRMLFIIALVRVLVVAVAMRVFVRMCRSFVRVFVFVVGHFFFSFKKSKICRVPYRL